MQTFFLSALRLKAVCFGYGPNYVLSNKTFLFLNNGMEKLQNVQKWFVLMT